MEPSKYEINLCLKENISVIFSATKHCSCQVVCLWWPHLDIMVFTQCCKQPLRKLSVKGACFIAKSNLKNTHAHTQWMDTYLKPVILCSCLSWSYKHTHIQGIGMWSRFSEMFSRCPSFSSTTPVMRPFVPPANSRRLHGDTCL